MRGVPSSSNPITVFIELNDNVAGKSLRRRNESTACSSSYDANSTQDKDVNKRYGLAPTLSPV